MCDIMTHPNIPELSWGDLRVKTLISVKITLQKLKKENENG